MHRLEIPAPLIAIGLGVAFLFVCGMVVVTHNHPCWIRRKLRIGAMLLSLTTVTAGCDTTERSCYEPVQNNQFQLGPDYGASTITINLNETTTLAGKILMRAGDLFSYRLTDTFDNELLRSDLAALDGAFDEDEEDFEVTLPDTLPEDTYTLSFFATTAATQGEYGWPFVIQAVRVIPGR